jgi:quinol monooxygenase YgiN
MIIVLGKVIADPTDRDAFIASARTVEAATRQEPGCIHYAFAQDLSDPSLFWLSETWTDIPSLDAHGNTPHIAVFRQEIAAQKLRLFLVKRYEGIGETVLASRSE